MGMLRIHGLMLLGMVAAWVLIAVFRRHEHGMLIMLGMVLVLSVPTLFIPLISWTVRRVKNPAYGKRRKFFDLFSACSIMLWLSSPWWLLLTNPHSGKVTEVAPVYLFIVTSMTAFFGIFWLGFRPSKDEMTEEYYSYWMNGKLIVCVMLGYIFIPMCWAAANGLQ